VGDRRTDDATLIESVRILSRTIQTDDGVIPACLAEVATRLEELVEERRWVPVGERLPESEETVDIAGEWGDCVGYYSVGRWRNVDDDSCWDAITHWRTRTPGPEGKG
jgi:hypothetical protein